jgi:hypothetical protein
MTLRNLVKYSGIWFGFVVNPYHWRLRFKTGSDGLLDDEPNIFGLHVYVGPVWMKVLIDDGNW